MKVSLIGLGGVAERIHLPALSSINELELIAACDPDEQRREKMSRRYSIPAVYENPEIMLEREKPELVIIGTPPDLHYSHCLMALQSGAHVVCEKPFVSSVKEADEILEKARRTGRFLTVNNQYRYMKIYRVPGEKIAAGQYGPPFLIQCWQQMFHPPQLEKNWRARLSRYTLFEFGTHALDLICYFFDSLPESIYVETPAPRPEFDSDVVVTAVLRFPKERVATMVFNRISHAPQRYFEMRIDCMEASLRISLGGLARASLDWSSTLGRPILRTSLVRGGEARVEKGGRSLIVAREPAEAFASATAEHLRQFLRRLQSGTLNNDGAKHARELIRIVLAGYESAKSRKVVTLSSGSQSES